MVDKLTKKQRSINMSRIGCKDTTPEFYVRKYIHCNKVRYSLHKKSLPGKPDIYLKKYNTVIFVNGCFWHGCPDHATWPKSNEAFWRHKIEANITRDRRIDAALEDAGWAVIRVWEHEAPEMAADRIERMVRDRMGGA